LTPNSKPRTEKNVSPHPRRIENPSRRARQGCQLPRRHRQGGAGRGRGERHRRRRHAPEPVPKEGAQAPRRGRHRLQVHRIRQLLERVAPAPGAEDVDRLADLPDGVRQGRAHRRLRGPRAPDPEWRTEKGERMIHVVAVLTAKPGKREEILKHFRANVPAVRAEKGCIEYGAAVDADPALPFQKKWGDDTFLVIEKWESMDALKAHAAAPHMAAYGAKTKELLAGRVIHILSPA